MQTDKVLSNERSYDTDQNDYFQKEDTQQERWELMGIKYGLIAGVLMSIYLLIINWGADVGMTFKFIKYVILGIVLAYALGKYKIGAPKFVFFKRGMMLGAIASGVSALVVAISNMAVYLFAPSATFQKFGLVTNSVGDAMVLSSVLLVEIFALGMILTFICLQYYKRNVIMK